MYMIKIQENLFLLGSSSCRRLLLIGILGNPGEDHLGSVADDTTDQTLNLELQQSLAGQRRSNLQTLGNDAGGDKFVGRNLLVKFVIGILNKF